MEFLCTEEESLLARITVNYLFLGQYETFRGSLKILSQRNPKLSIAISQAILEKLGEIDGISWSRSISSPSHLSWLACGEISKHQEPNSATEKEMCVFDNFSLLKRKIEALFLLQRIIHTVEEKILFHTQEKSAREGKDLYVNDDNGGVSKLGNNSERRKLRNGVQDLDDNSGVSPWGTDSGVISQSSKAKTGVNNSGSSMSGTNSSRNSSLETDSTQVFSLGKNSSRVSTSENDSAGVSEGSKPRKEAQALNDDGDAETSSSGNNHGGVYEFDYLGKGVKTLNDNDGVCISGNISGRVSESSKLRKGLQSSDGHDDDVVSKSGNCIGFLESRMLNKGLQGLKMMYDSWNAQLKTDVLHSGLAYKYSRSQDNLVDRKYVDREPLHKSTIAGIFLLGEENNFLQHLYVWEPELLQSICLNLFKQKQLQKVESKATNPDDSSSGEEIMGQSVFILQKEVQRSLLGLVKIKLENENLYDCLKHVRHLQDDFDVPESEYRDIIHAIVRKILSQEYGVTKQEKFRMQMLELYESIQSSGSISLVSLVESVQDSFLHEAAMSYKVSSGTSLPPPLHYLHQCFRSLRGEDTIVPQGGGLNATVAVSHTLRQLYHYSRATGAHMFEIVMDAAIASIKSHEFQKAVDVLAVFPRLQPLAAVLGWDLLAGDTSARRQMMEFLWDNKSTEPSLNIKHGDVSCCVDHLCGQLCYHLNIAYFSAVVNSGQDWSASLFLFPYQGTSKHTNTVPDIKPADAFVTNLVLERLTMHSPIRVLFDVVPDIKFSHARALLKMSPVPTSLAEYMRMQDLEILELHFGVQATVLALAAMDRSTIENDNMKMDFIALNLLESLRDHINSISNVPRKILLMSIVVDLLHIEETSIQSLPNALEMKLNSFLKTRTEASYPENRQKVTPVLFVRRLLEVLRECLPSHGIELEDQNMNSAFPRGFTNHSALKAWELKLSNIQHFIEEWEWRLAVLERLTPVSQCQWQWKEALTVLRAAPSTLLNMCVQRAEYDLGEEAVHRFSLPPEDEAALQLAAWVDGAVARASVDDVVTQVAEGSSSPEEALKLAGLRSPLSPLASALLCIDVAAASAKVSNMSKQLLQKAKLLLTEVSASSLHRQGLNQIEQIQDACMVSVSKRVVQCLQDLLEKVCIEKQQTLQSVLSGTDMANISTENAKQGHRYRALSILQQTIEDAHSGKRMFLSGKLHNLVKALADEDLDDTNVRTSAPYSERKYITSAENGFLLGCGVRNISKPPSSGVSMGSGDHVGETMFFPLKGTGKRFLGPLSSKPFAYLSAFILYIATIGDIVDGVDTTHDFNFFQLVYEQSNDLLTRLVFERGSADGAGKVADIMGADLVHEVISACVPPIYPPKSLRGWARIPLLPSRLPFSRTAGHNSEQRTGLYPLKLDVIKHLATLSPVRAILACVFGTTMFRKSIPPLDAIDNGVETPCMDSDCAFYETALDQSDRFPTLNRWIQTQAKIQYLSGVPMLRRNGFVDGHKKAGLLKRSREDEIDIDSEEEDVAHTVHVRNSNCENLENLIDSSMAYDDIMMRKVSSKKDNLDSRNSASLFFEWENESIYEEAVQRCISEGKLSDALAIADRYLRDGAPDYLLRLLIEQGDDVSAASGHWQSFWNNSWQYCLRLRNKKLAASLAMENARKWDLDSAIDVLTMCSCHLTEHDDLHGQVLELKKSLQLYGRILRSDVKFTNWQEVERLCQRDPEDLARRLAAKGAVSAALEVAESYHLREEYCRELQGQKLVELLISDPINGGGPAEALRFLMTLHTPEDALPVAMDAMKQLPSLQSKQLLVHFFLKKQIGVLSDLELSKLHKLSMGLRILGSLPLPWQQRCSALHEHPQLILETLLMWKELHVASQLLQSFPSLRDDNLILTYATKAISIGSYKKYEHKVSNPIMHIKSSNRQNMAGRMKNGNSLQNIQRDSRQSHKITQKESSKKRTSERELITSGNDDRSDISAKDTFERLVPFTITEGVILTGDRAKDDLLRDSHCYEGAPCFPLFKALIALCSSEEVSVNFSVRICVDQMKKILSAHQLHKDTPSEIIERAFYATEAFVQALLHAKVMIRKLLGNQELTTNIEGSKESNSLVSAEIDGMKWSSVGIHSGISDNISELLFQVVEWLSRAEVLQSLLSSNVTASLDDVLDKDSAEKLRDRLINDERYNMAVYCCTKCKIDAFPVWRAWALALVQMEHYAQARVKLKQALKLLKSDPAQLVREIVAAMEACPPVDIASARSLYDHMAKNASTMQDDSLSTDAYLNVLYMPSFIKSERSRSTADDPLDNFATISAQGGEEGVRSNLDRYRYEECIFYLQEYARQDLLSFMFKHCHYADACLLFFPPKSRPSLSVSSNTSVQLSSTASQRSDPLATDYGSVEDLCELCIAYGAMPVLERVIATRELSSASLDPLISQHTTASLTRICTYCENHKHFNHLYRFQVLKKDHVAAALCCIQLFINASNQDQALRHLERAKTHFDEGYNARLQGGEVSKSSSKALRGKSPSDRFTEEELTKFSVRVSTQMQVVNCFNDTEGPPWKHSLFGNPNDGDTIKRRSEVVEALAERNFDLAFRIITDFQLPPVPIYAAVAANLAERKKVNQLTELFKNIKPFIADDLDEVIGAAIMVFAKQKERPDRLIEMLSNSHRKVLSCVACGRLKTAFQIASRSGSIPDVQYVSDMAKRTGLISVVDMCKQWLSRQK